MDDSSTSSRRRFLKAVGGAGALLAASPAERAGHPSPLAFVQRAAGDEDDRRPPVDDDLGTLSPIVQQIADENTGSVTPRNFSSHKDWTAHARPLLQRLLSHEPPRVALKAETLERTDCGDHVREKVKFSTAAATRISAYVLVPTQRQPPFPAVVDLHSHGGMFLFGKEKVVDLGDNHPAMTAYHQANYDGRPTATALVRRGYLVIAADAFFFGERRYATRGNAAQDLSQASDDELQRLNQQCRAKEATLAKGLTFAGATWPGVVAWDDMRTVDYLLSRTDVDPDRIGCLGISMGGYRSLLLAALDERIAAACITGFMSTTRPMIPGHLEIHSHVHFLPGLHRHFDWPEVAGLTAPRALLVQQCARDALFPLVGMQAAVRQIAGSYEFAGAKDKYQGRFYDVPHRFSVEMQDEAFAWLDRHLG